MPRFTRHTEDTDEHHQGPRAAGNKPGTVATRLPRSLQRDDARTRCAPTTGATTGATNDPTKNATTASTSPACQVTGACCSNRLAMREC